MHIQYGTESLSSTFNIRYHNYFTFLDMPDTESTTRLLEACKAGDLKSIKQLLELGGDPSQLVKYAYERSHPTMINALHFTCMLGKLDALKILADYCKNHRFEIRGDQLGLNPLHYACRYGHFDIIQYLCSNAKCNPHGKTFDGSMLASYPGHSHVYYTLSTISSIL